MTSDEKPKWDALNELRKAAFERFSTRRKVEFQLLAIFWTAIAALILLFLKGEIKSWGHFHSLAVTFVSAFCFLSFVSWTKGMNRAHKLDRDVSIYFEREMMKVAGVTFSKEIEDALATNNKRRGVFSYWSHQLQVMVTALLILALSLVVWTNSERSDSPERESGRWLNKPIRPAQGSKPGHE